MPPLSSLATLRAARGAAKRAALGPWWWATKRRVLLTSVPKCGTHLLRRLLNVIAIPARREVEWDITPEDLDAALRERRGSAVVGHVLARPEIRRFVADTRTRVLFIYRDPRDQVVSHLFHFRRDRKHPLHPLFRDELGDDDAALLAVIRGVRVSETAHVPRVDLLYGGFRGWLDDPSVCWSTFERLIGPRGGGSVDDQLREVRALLRHLGFPLASPAIVRMVARRVFDPGSPTFRIGQIGSWRKYFGPQHCTAFKEVAGQLLIDLGYERSLDW